MTVAPTHYRPDIDGLRAVAVMAVVLHHLWPSLMPGGYVGVDVFFVISGYLITGIIGREMTQGRFNLRLFYERRIRRIFPALFSVLAATLFAGYFLLLPSDYALTLRTALATLFLAYNIVFWRERGGYFNATEEKLNPLLYTWPLAVEEQFYLLFPALLLFCHRYFYRLITPILLLCGLGSLGLAVLLIAGRAEAVFYLSPFRAWELLAGSLLALGAVLGAVAIIHAGSSGLTLAGRLLHLQPVVYVGLISYSLYLWHWPVLVLGDYANGMAPLTPPLVLAVSLLLAGVSYRFIEQPFRRRQTPLQRPAFPVAAGVTAALALQASTGRKVLSSTAGEQRDRRAPFLAVVDGFRSLPHFRYLDPIQWLCLEECEVMRDGVALHHDSHHLSEAGALALKFRLSEGMSMTSHDEFGSLQKRPESVQ